MRRIVRGMYVCLVEFETLHRIVVAQGLALVKVIVCDTLCEIDEFRDDIGRNNIIIVKEVEQNVESFIHVCNDPFLLWCLL